jgi:hypothetical protein
MGPMSLICKHIPTRVIEYVLKCPMFCKDKYIEAGRMLHVYAKNRGIISGSGMPNYSEAAKIVLKKYVHGDLLYATLPPGIEENAPESLRVLLWSNDSLTSTTRSQRTTSRPLRRALPQRSRNSTSRSTNS